LIQIAVADGEPPGPRLDRGLHLIESVDSSVGLVLLPELWTVGAFNFGEFGRAAEPLNGPTASRLAAAARQGKFWLHGGSIVERSPEGDLYNTSLLFDPAGRMAASYRKMHLFGFEFGEKAILRAGESIVDLGTDIGHLALTTCYDLRFPELYRCLSARGAEIMLVTSSWPSARLEHWLILTRARAIENLSYVVACNAAGAHGGHELAGNSLIIDPWGKVLARSSADEGMLYGEIDRESVSAIRAQFPALRDRRG
jgi:predicted amidohydrolase